MNWPHRITITRGPSQPSQGQLDKTSGVWKPDESPRPNVEVYAGDADVQDPGILRRRDEQGLPIIAVTDDVTIFLRDESKVRLIQVGDSVAVNWGTAVAEGEAEDVSSFSVTKVNRIDGSLRVRAVT